MNITKNEFNWLPPDAKLHHTGLAVHSIMDSGFQDLMVHEDPIQRVKVAFVTFNGVAIELIEPLNETSPVSNSLKKGIKLVHLCYEVNHLDESIKFAKQNGFSIISKPVPAVAFEGRKIQWLFHKTLGLVELVERVKNESI